MAKNFVIAVLGILAFVLYFREPKPPIVKFYTPPPLWAIGAHPDTRVQCSITTVGAATATITF